MAFASTLANYACRQVTSGRRLGTPLNVNDITSAYCRRRKGVRLQSLYHRDDKTGVWREVLVEDHRATPADLAAARIDVPEFLGTLSDRNRSIAEQLAAGESTTSVAKMFRVSFGRISQLRRELCEAWGRFQGEQLQPAEVAA